MSDGLTVSGGGSFAVATAELGGASAGLRDLAGVAGSCTAQLATIDRLVDRAALFDVDAPISALAAERAIDEARGAIEAVRAQAAVLCTALEAAAAAYGTAERLGESAARELAAALAYGLGTVAPGLALMALPFAGFAIAAWALSPEERRAQAIAWLEQHGGLLSDPLVIEAIRLTVLSLDEFGAGVMRLPPPLVQFLGSEALGILGYSSSAAVLTGTARHFGLLRETAVSVQRRTSRQYETPAVGFAERAQRIPAQAAQIRIDRYEMPGEPDRFEVYLGGTKNGELLAGEEPWDTTSNLTALSLGDSGSMTAVRQAMHEAGVTSETPVQFTGYSQGALIGVRLADSGDYDTRGIFTVGGPVGQLHSPEVPYVAIEHREDIVPAAGGTHVSDTPVVVRRSVFEGEEVPKDAAFPAHRLSLYRETAALLDETNDRRIVEAGERLDAFSSGATKVETTTWHAERLAAADEATESGR